MSLAVWIDQTTLSILTLIVLVVIIAFGLWYINDLKREVEEEREPVTDEERLQEFEAARDAGELSQAEFERVRDALLKIHQEPVPPAGAPAEPAIEESSEPRKPRPPGAPA